MSQKPSTRKNAKSSSFTLFAKIIKFILITFIITAMVGGIYVTKIILTIAKEAPEVDVNKFLALSQPSIILDDQGNQMDILHSDEVRFPLKLEEMGENIKNAFISIEDERFYKHEGVDYKRTIGVTLRDILGQFTGNRDMQGGSTLTQQIIKNTFLTREQKYERKIQEIYMALQAEELLTKDQILATYLNSIYLGGSANGVEAAARQYFNKSAKDLSVIEAAYIAGTTQSPSNYYAFSQSSMANPSKYINRTKLVLNAMLKNGKITELDHAAYMNQLDTEGIAFTRTKIVSDKYNFEYFTRPVIDQVRNDLKEKLGYTDEEINDLIAYGGLVIHSTMDRDAQEYTIGVLNDFANVKAEYMHTSKDPAGNEIDTRTEAQAAFSAVDYRTGQVKVLVGGRNIDEPSTSNRAYYSPTFTNSVLRQIGSTTKPLTVYGPALDTGAITLGTPAKDMQIDPTEDRPIASLYNTLNRKWPNNVNFRYTGFTTIRQAIVGSYNTVSARTLYTISGNQFEISKNYGSKFGLVLPENPVASNLALGSNVNDNKDGGNPLILATAYGAFGNSGVVTESILYTKVTDSSGNVILENIPKSEQVLRPQTAYLVYDVLKDIVAKNVPKARLTSMPLAGKTGTATNENNLPTDIWFAGVSPYYSASMWIGSDQRKPLLVPGSNNTVISFITQVAYGKIMAYLQEGLPVTNVTRPSGLITASFCKESGGIPNEQCYVAGTVASDLFVSGTQPTTICDVHTYEAPVIDPTVPTEPGNNGNGNGNGNGGN